MYVFNPAISNAWLQWRRTLVQNNRGNTLTNLAIGMGTNLQTNGWIVAAILFD